MIFANGHRQRWPFLVRHEATLNAILVAEEAPFQQCEVALSRKCSRSAARPRSLHLVPARFLKNSCPFPHTATHHR